MRYLIAFFLALPTFVLADCGPDAPCEIAGGSYHILMPETAGKDMPALVFFHGHNATGGMIFCGGLKADFAGAGYVVIAPNGTPIKGRGIGGWHQGSVWDSLALARRTNQCRSNPDSIDVGDRFRCRTWADSFGAGAVQFCEHDGGHGMPRGWTTIARDWFEAG